MVHRNRTDFTKILLGYTELTSRPWSRVQSPRPRRRVRSCRGGCPRAGAGREGPGCPAPPRPPRRPPRPSWGGAWPPPPAASRGTSCWEQVVQSVDNGVITLWTGDKTLYFLVRGEDEDEDGGEDTPETHGGHQAHAQQPRPAGALRQRGHGHLTSLSVKVSRYVV